MTDSYPRRCFWCTDLPIYQNYHDVEWGVPALDDFALFEKVCLEGFQSGLSWLTVLIKRERFREVFEQFDFYKVARFSEEDVERLLQDPGIIRHRGKINAVINNALQAIKLKEEFGSLANYFWQYRIAPIPNRDCSKEALLNQTMTAESMALSKDLKKRGWKFVGPTTMYALMQALGLVNDHEEGCFVREDVALRQDAAYQFLQSQKSS